MDEQEMKVEGKLDPGQSGSEHLVSGAQMSALKKENMIDVIVVGLSAILCLLAMDGIRKFIYCNPPGRRLVRVVLRKHRKIRVVI